jgi:trehalose/maltose hydrolase-like predicted phosphorylase
VTALESDVGDVQGGTTQEGIHMGVITGTLDLIQRGYVGTDFRDGTLNFSPKLNDRLDGLSLPMRFRKTAERYSRAACSRMRECENTQSPRLRFRSLLREDGDARVHLHRT